MLLVRPDYIKHHLAHAIRAPNGRVYNRTAHPPTLRTMIHEWATYLKCTKSGGDVIPMTRKVG